MEKINFSNTYDFRCVIDVIKGILENSTSGEDCLEELRKVKDFLLTKIEELEKESDSTKAFAEFAETSRMFAESTKEFEDNFVVEGNTWMHGVGEAISVVLLWEKSELSFNKSFGDCAERRWIMAKLSFDFACLIESVVERICKECPVPVPESLVRPTINTVENITELIEQLRLLWTHNENVRFAMGIQRRAREHLDSILQAHPLDEEMKKNLFEIMRNPVKWHFVGKKAEELMSFRKYFYAKKTFCDEKKGSLDKAANDWLCVFWHCEAEDAIAALTVGVSDEVRTSILAAAALIVIGSIFTSGISIRTNMSNVFEELMEFEVVDGVITNEGRRRMLEIMSKLSP